MVLDMLQLTFVDIIRLSVKLMVKKALAITEHALQCT